MTRHALLTAGQSAADLATEAIAVLRAGVDLWVDSPAGQMSVDLAACGCHAVSTWRPAGTNKWNRAALVLTPAPGMPVDDLLPLEFSARCVGAAVTGGLWPAGIRPGLPRAITLTFIPADDPNGLPPQPALSQDAILESVAGLHPGDRVRLWGRPAGRDSSGRYWAQVTAVRGVLDVELNRGRGQWDGDASRRFWVQDRSELPAAIGRVVAWLMDGQ